MENKRETKEFTTSGGHKIVYKTYLTGREFNEIQNVYLKDTKVEMAGKEMKVEGFSPSITFKANEKMLELLVESVDGVVTNVVDTILDLPNVETQEIIEIVGSISDKKKV
jgi:hypothetical protein